MVKEIGKYNISLYDSESEWNYDRGIPYAMATIDEFDGDKPTGKNKTLYFRQNIGTERKYIMPEFKNEEEVGMWMEYRNNAKIQIYNKVVVEEVR